MKSIVLYIYIILFVICSHASSDQTDYDKLINTGSCEGCVFVGKDFKGFDFSEASLVSTQFINSNLDEANFNNANLTGANFISSSLKNVNFKNSTLIRSYFNNSSIDNADFKNADLTSAHFHNMEINNTNFVDTIIYNTTSYEVTGNSLHSEIRSIQSGWIPKNYCPEIVDSQKYESWARDRTKMNWHNCYGIIINEDYKYEGYFYNKVQHGFGYEDTFFYDYYGFFKLGRRYGYGVQNDEFGHEVGYWEGLTPLLTTLFEKGTIDDNEYYNKKINKIESINIGYVNTDSDICNGYPVKLIKDKVTTNTLYKDIKLCSKEFARRYPIIQSGPRYIIPEFNRLESWDFYGISIETGYNKSIYMGMLDTMGLRDSGGRGIQFDLEEDSMVLTRGNYKEDIPVGHHYRTSIYGYKFDELHHYYTKDNFVFKGSRLSENYKDLIIGGNFKWYFWGSDYNNENQQFNIIHYKENGEIIEGTYNTSEFLYGTKYVRGENLKLDILKEDTLRKIEYNRHENNCLNSPEYEFKKNDQYKSCYKMIVYNNGDVIVGYMRGGLKQGPITIYKHNGNIISGIFDHDDFITGTMGFNINSFTKDGNIKKRHERMPINIEAGSLDTKGLFCKINDYLYEGYYFNNKSVHHITMHDLEIDLHYLGSYSETDIKTIEWKDKNKNTIKLNRHNLSINNTTCEISKNPGTIIEQMKKIIASQSSNNKI